MPDGRSVALDHWRGETLWRSNPVNSLGCLLHPWHKRAMDVNLNASVDGRRLRSQRSREAIIAAVMALVAEGQATPGAEDVAARAGVGLRSVFRHFNDMESLYAELAMRVASQFGDALAPYASETWPAVMVEVAERRLALHERLLPFRRAADIHRLRSGTIQAYHERLRLLLRTRLESIAAARVDPDTLERLDLWLSFEAYQRLRSEQGLDHDRIVALVLAEVRRLIDAA